MARPPDDPDLYLKCEGKHGCGQTKHCSEFHWFGHKYHNNCRSCTSKARGYTPRGLPVGPNGEVTCSACGRKFVRQGSQKGRRCKFCRSEYLEEWRQNNPDLEESYLKKRSDKLKQIRQQQRESGEAMTAKQAQKILNRVNVRKLEQEGYGPKVIARKLGLGVSTVYAIRRDIKKTQSNK
jgi:hypothetical protein